MSKSVPVRFLKAWRNYFKGDESAFPAEDAKQLEEGGVVELLGVQKASKPGAKKPLPKASGKSPVQAAGNEGGDDNDEPDPNATDDGGGNDDPDSNANDEGGGDGDDDEKP